MGYLIPLGCGHNGAFSSSEKWVYFEHLKKAGFWV